MSENNQMYTWDDNNWKRILENPEQLLLTSTIYNISKYLIRTRPSNIVKYNSYEKELIENIIYSINKKSIESNLLIKCDPGLFNKLKTSLPQSVKIQDYCEIFEKIVKLQKSSKYLNVLKKEYLKSLEESKSRDMDILEFYILQFVLEKFSVEELKDIMKKSITSTYFLNQKTSIQKRLNSQDLTKLMVNEIDHLLSDYKKKSKKIPSNPDKKLKFLHQRIPHWKYDLEATINEISNFDIINKAIIKRKVHNSKKPIQETTKIVYEKKFESFLDKKISTIFRLISNQAIYQIRGDYMKFTRNLSKREFSQRVSEELKNIMYDDPHSHTRFFEHTNSYALSSAFSITLSKFITSILENKKTKFKKILVKKYVKYVTPQLKLQNTQDEIMSISNKWDFFQLLVEFIQDCSKQLFFKVHKTIQKINNSKFILREKIKFETEYYDSLLKNLSDTSLFSMPPISKTISKKIIHELFSELKRKKKHFRVFLLVGGIDCNFKKFKINKVHYFDGRKFQFKEGTKFDRWPGAPISINEKFNTLTSTYEQQKINQKIIEMKRNSGRAYVDVIASTAHSAIEIAKIEVKKTFDSLVFASTAKAKRGFKPQLPIDFVFLEENKPYAGQRSGPRENDSDMLVIDETYDKIIQFYDELQNNSTYPIERLSRTLDWYHRGQWAQTIHEKFVSHWIALEHLILKQIEKEDVKAHELTEYIPQLTHTWQKIKGFVVGQYFRGIESELNEETELTKFLDSEKKFKGWRQNRLIILEHLNLLKSNTTGEVKRCVELIQKELKHKTAIKNAVIDDRKEMKFKISILIAKRNEVFHEGMSYSYELELLMRELRKIVTEIIDIHLKYRSVISLKQMIREANRPIQV